MAKALQEFLNEFFEALNAKNYEKIRNLLSINEILSAPISPSKRKQSVTNRMKLLVEISSMDFKGLADQSESENGEIWNLIISSHLKILKQLNSVEPEIKKYFHAVNEQINVINNFLRIFSNALELPVLYTIGEDCWKLAVLSGSSEAQEQAARSINKLFIACITERSVLTLQSRKWGTYRIAALLLRIYFHLGQLNLVLNVLKALQACELPEIDEYPRAHTVTFKYFLGRYHFGREEFDLAENCFTFCFERVQQEERFKKQSNAILHFLIPIKLILHLEKPSNELISTFESEQNRLFYKNLIETISAGDLESFKDLLKLNYKQLLRAGSYGLYEKVLLLVLRQRIRRIYRLNDNSTRISLILLQRLFDKDATLEDVTCLIANCISRGLIRGYISEEKLFLVLSSQNPFPTGLSSALCDK